MMGSTIRVISCSQSGCSNPATWKMGTWWMCDEHIREYLSSPEMFDKGIGLSYFGTAYRMEEYASPDQGMSDEWLRLMTVEVPPCP